MKRLGDTGMTLATEKEYDSGTEHVIICLKEQGFTTPLANAVLQQSQQLFALRIWILDNSGSMNEADGRQLVATKKRTDVQWVKCTRFAELQECVYYHAQLNALLEAPTKFILLNPPSNGLSQYFGVGEMDLERIEEDLISLQKTLMNVCPRGVTPLTTHLRNIFHTIQGMEDSLRREGKMISIVLATDGKLSFVIFRSLCIHSFVLLIPYTVMLLVIPRLAVRRVWVNDTDRACRI